MSSGLECCFYEEKPGRWFYVLEHGCAPKDARDWREYATAYGPFATEDAAYDHLRAHHRNPGGSSMVDSSHFKSDAVLKKLFDNAKRC